MTGTKAANGALPTRRRFRWLRVAGTLLLASLLLAGAGLLWLANDRAWVKRTIEDAVSALSEHRFSIEGEFDYDLGRIIQVRAGKVRWRDTSSETAPRLLELERFSGAFDLWSLIDRPIRITGLQASQGTLWFEWGAEDRFNWRFGAPAAPASESPAPRDPLPLVIERASVEKLSLRFRHPTLTDELEILVVRAGHEQDADHRLVLSGEAVLQGHTLALNARIGPFPQLAVAGAVDFDLSVTGPLAALNAAGSVAALASLQDLQLSAQLQAPNASDLAQQLKLPLATTGEVQLRADVNSVGDRIRTTGGGTFGEFRFDASLLSDSLPSLQGLQAVVDSSGPSIGAIAAMAGLSGLPDAPYELELRAQQTAQGLELQRLRLETTGLSVNGSGIARSLPDLRDIDLTLTAKGSDSGVIAELFDLDPPAQRLPFQMRTVVLGHGAGKDDEIDARLQLGDATASLSGSLSEASDFSGSRLQLTVDAPDAHQLTGLLGVAAPANTGLRLSGSAAFTPQQIRVDNLVASIADAELRGSARLERGPGPPVASLEAQTQGADLAAVVGPLLPKNARSALPNLTFAAAAELRLAKGSLQVASANATVGQNRFQFQGRIDAAPSGMDLAGELSAKGDNLAELLGGFKLADLPLKAFSLESRLRLSPEAIRFEALNFSGPQVRLGGAIGLLGEGYSRIEFDLTGSADDLTALIPDNEHYTPAKVPLQLTTRGVLDPARITVERLEAELGATRLGLSGELQLQPTLSAKGVRLDASGQRLSDLGTLGTLQLTDRPFKITASMQGDAREQLIEDLRFESGGNKLTGRLRYRDQGKPMVEGAVTSSRLDLDELRVADWQDDESKATTDTGERVFTDDPLPFDLLDRFDADIALRIDDLVSHARRWRNLVVEASVKQGVLEVRQAQVDAARGKLKWRGTLRPAPAGRKLSVEITAADAMLATAQMTSEELDRLPRHALDARLSATGNTPHELAASLDGFVWLIGGEGQAQRTALAPLFGDFLTELFGAVKLTSAKETHTRVNCSGVYLEIEDGKVETAPTVVLQTDHVLVFALGKVDLASEKIDFTFESTPLRGIGLSLGSYVQPFTKLTGTLSQPQITLNPGIEGGVALATGGLTILIKSLWTSWFGSHRICEKVAAKAVELRRKRDPGNVPELATLIAGTGAAEATRPATPAPEPKAAGSGPRSLHDEVYD